MITAKEYIKEKPTTIWIHGLEMLEHVLRGDVSQTAYGDQSPSEQHLPALRKELEEHKEVNGGYQEALEEHYLPNRKRVRVESKHGAFKVNAYLNGGKKECFTRRKREITHKKGITLCMDVGISAGERSGTRMVERHRKIYGLAAKYAAENRPCRVVACCKILYWGAEVKELRLYIVIKNYDEPMYPGIWGAFKTNASTNTLLNVISDYLIGTRDSSHGSPGRLNVAEDMDYDEAQIIGDEKSRIFKERI